MNATSVGPPRGNPLTLISAFGSPLANVVTFPVWGSTREILPAWPSATYNAPSGPMVLPMGLSNPEAKTDGGPRSGGAQSAGRIPPAVISAARISTKKTLIGSGCRPEFISSLLEVSGWLWALAAIPPAAVKPQGPGSE